MAYATMSAEDLRKATLAARDKELDDIRAKVAELSRNQNPAPVVHMHLSIAQPEAWNLNAKDISESFEDFMISWINYVKAASISTAAEDVKLGIFWSTLGLKATKKCDKDWKFTDADKVNIDSVVAKIRAKLKDERIPIVDHIKFG
jgi:hypothetical protein